MTTAIDWLFLRINIHKPSDSLGFTDRRCVNNIFTLKRTKPPVYGGFSAFDVGTRPKTVWKADTHPVGYGTRAAFAAVGAKMQIELH